MIKNWREVQMRKTNVMKIQKNMIFIFKLTDSIQPTWYYIHVSRDVMYLYTLYILDEIYTFISLILLFA